MPMIQYEVVDEDQKFGVPFESLEQAVYSIWNAYDYVIAVEDGKRRRLNIAELEEVARLRSLRPIKRAS